MKTKTLRNVFQDLLTDPNHQSAIMKSITFEEPVGDDRGTIRIASSEPIVPQFKQLEPLKMVKRDPSKDYIPSSSSTSSADTIVTVAMRKSLGYFLFVVSLSQCRFSRCSSSRLVLFLCVFKVNVTVRFIFLIQVKPQHLLPVTGPIILFHIRLIIPVVIRHYLFIHTHLKCFNWRV